MRQNHASENLDYFDNKKILKFPVHHVIAYLDNIEQGCRGFNLIRIDFRTEIGRFKRCKICEVKWRFWVLSLKRHIFQK